MDLQNLAQAIVFLAALMTPIGIGLAFKGAFEAIGRNPTLENSLFSKALIAAALIEVTLIFAFLAFFII